MSDKVYGKFNELAVNNITSKVAVGGAVTPLAAEVGDSFAAVTISGAQSAAIYLEDTGYEATGNGVCYFVYDDGVLIIATASRNGSTTSGTIERARMSAAGNLLVGTATENTTTGNAKIQSSNGIYLGNTANAAANVLDWYEEGTFTVTATGMTTSPTQTVSYVRVGNIVNLTLLTLTGTSSATTFTLTGMPTACRPAATRTVKVRIADNGVIDNGIMEISSAGVMTIYKGLAAGVFTAIGAKTIYSESLSYII